MQIIITRNKALSDENGTFGHMSIDGVAFCVTCEQPWNNNLPNASCIPVGQYDLLPYESPAHGSTVVFHNPDLGIFGTPAMIPHGKQGRSLCEIHNANWPYQLRGCVAVGQEIKDLPPHGRGITSSVVTLHTLVMRWGARTGIKAIIS